MRCPAGIVLMKGSCSRAGRSDGRRGVHCHQQEASRQYSRSLANDCSVRSHFHPRPQNMHAEMGGHNGRGLVEELTSLH